MCFLLKTVHNRNHYSLTTSTLWPYFTIGSFSQKQNQQGSPQENKKIKEEHQIIIGTIAKLVNYKTSALCSTFFRAERRASGLPPPLNKNKVSNILVAPNSKLRLYCYILNDHHSLWRRNQIGTTSREMPKCSGTFFLANRIAEFFDAEKKNLGINQQSKQLPNECLGYNQGFTI